MIPPRCTCGHSRRSHGAFVGGPFDYCHASENCLCKKYQPKRSLRVRAPIVRKASKKGRKILPRCKACAHPQKCHAAFEYQGEGVVLEKPHCARCIACPGYQRARSSQQKRRTPAAAVKRIADDLWTRVVHARPGGCEVQQYHAHGCVGGFQAMHGIPRTYNVTRHMPINGFKGCAGTHTYFSHHPEEWSAVLVEAWGLTVFRQLWADARSMRDVDMDATVASLRAELAKAAA